MEMNSVSGISVYKKFCRKEIWLTEKFSEFTADIRIRRADHDSCICNFLSITSNRESGRDVAVERREVGRQR
jgi:hypothetical protein